MGGRTQRPRRGERTEAARSVSFGRVFPTTQIGEGVEVGEGRKGER